MPTPYRPRAYYSERKNGVDIVSLDLKDLRDILALTYRWLNENGFLSEAFGNPCIDGPENGYVDALVERQLQKRGLWPIRDSYEECSEDDCLTIIEFLYDHVSEPQSKDHHTFCGYHYSDFDKRRGQAEFRRRISDVLKDYGQGWELSEIGEVASLPPTGMETLLTATPPTKDLTVLEKVAAATSRFRRHGSTISEREIAVRDLADVLEWIKPQINTALLNKDSTDLYNIANQFGIRHLNQNQKLGYDKAVWLSWIFYHYLNTINASLHIVDRQKPS